jgi:nitroreductase
MRTESVGPFGAAVRAELVAATEDDQSALRGLGTYGFVSGERGYMVGAVHPDRPMAFEDFGFVIERAVLFATALDLGTVWLGGTFTKSRFAAAIGLREDEALAAAVALGYPADRRGVIDRLVRSGARGDHRLPWEALFFDGAFGASLGRESAGPFAVVLDMVRRAPSASNKQPWRVVRDGQRWHLFMQRTRRYAPRNALVGVADMQRIDMGIAMCHFALTAEELGLAGRWAIEDPRIALPDSLTSYEASWTT